MHVSVCKWNCSEPVPVCEHRLHVGVFNVSISASPPALTSPTETDRVWTIFSCAIATTLWPLISMIRCPTRTPPRSAMPPRIRLQIWNPAELYVSVPLSSRKTDLSFYDSGRVHLRCHSEHWSRAETWGRVFWWGLWWREGSSRYSALPSPDSLNPGVKRCH